MTEDAGASMTLSDLKKNRDYLMQCRRAAIALGLLCVLLRTEGETQIAVLMLATYVSALEFGLLAPWGVGVLGAAAGIAGALLHDRPVWGQLFLLGAALLCLWGAWSSRHLPNGRKTDALLAQASSSRQDRDNRGRE